MHIAPGWYGVNGTSDVRWWDGAKFRTILLRNGVVTYEKAKSQQPSDVRWWDGHSFREVTLVDGTPRYRFTAVFCGSRWRSSPSASAELSHAHWLANSTR